MARNLQATLAPTDSVRIFDINTAAVDGLARAMRSQQAGGAAVHVARSAEHVSIDAVCENPAMPASSHDEFVLSMI